MSDFQEGFDYFFFWSAYILSNEKELNCGNQSQTQGKNPSSKE